ncbi:MAG TPA: hypothetical protein VEL76_13730 [Gemmataceae bacterium]|nr:hypothetical protein [Gemmataceae bacterium]
MFEWYAGLSPWLRFGVAGAFLLASTIALLCGRFWPWGWGVGAVLLAFSFPNDAQRKGYHDF